MKTSEAMDVANALRALHLNKGGYDNLVKIAGTIVPIEGCVTEYDSLVLRDYLVEIYLQVGNGGYGDEMYDKGYDDGYNDGVEQTLVGLADEELAKDGLMRLPKDADGEYVHIGDVMVYADGDTCPKPAVALVSQSVFLTDDGPRYADMCRHYRPSTVEDVLFEFGKICQDGYDIGNNIHEFADKIRELMQDD